MKMNVYSFLFVFLFASQSYGMDYFWSFVGIPTSSDGTTSSSNEDTSNKPSTLAESGSPTNSPQGQHLNLEAIPVKEIKTSAEIVADVMAQKEKLELEFLREENRLLKAQNERLESKVSRLEDDLSGYKLDKESYETRFSRLSKHVASKKEHEDFDLTQSMIEMPSSYTAAKKDNLYIGDELIAENISKLLKYAESGEVDSYRKARESVSEIQPKIDICRRNQEDTLTTLNLAKRQLLEQLEGTANTDILVEDQKATILPELFETIKPKIESIDKDIERYTAYFGDSLKMNQAIKEKHVSNLKSLVKKWKKRQEMPEISIGQPLSLQPNPISNSSTIESSNKMRRKLIRQPTISSRSRLVAKSETITKTEEEPTPVKSLKQSSIQQAPIETVNEEPSSLSCGSKFEHELAKCSANLAKSWTMCSSYTVNPITTFKMPLSEYIADVQGLNPQQVKFMEATNRTHDGLVKIAGDGDCAFRSVIVGLFLGLLEKNISPETIHSLAKLMFERELHSKIKATEEQVELLKASAAVFSYIATNFDCLTNDKIFAMMNEQSFSLPLIYSLRLLVSQNVKSLGYDLTASALEASWLNDLMTPEGVRQMGRYTSSDELEIIGKSLGIVINISKCTSRDPMVTAVGKAEETENYLDVLILNDHYSVITKTFSDADGEYKRKVEQEQYANAELIAK